MSHTPGPWRVHSEVPNRIILHGSACYEVVDLVRMEQYHNYADMRLIAAAPSLLAALKNHLPWREEPAQGWGEWEDAVNAINKAEGRE